MAEWRERGYVPDSDSDEDDIIESPELPRSVPKVITPAELHGLKSPFSVRGPSSSPDPLGELPSAALLPSTTIFKRGERNEPTIQDQDSLPSVSQTLGEGIESLKQNDQNAVAISVTIPIPPQQNENLFSAYSPPTSQNDYSQPQEGTESLSSSPLSSVRTFSTIKSPTRDPTREKSSDNSSAAQKGQNGRISEKQSRQLEEEDGEDLNGELSLDLLERLEGVRRSKRQRAPIQLHPYVLEEQRYQQTVKSRGLKPVRVAYIQERNNHERRSLKGSVNDEEYESEHGFDAQDAPRQDEVQDVNDLPMDDDNDFTLDKVQQSPKAAFQTLDGDEDLQNVQTLFHAQSDDPKHHILKRRKINHMYGKRNIQSSKAAKPAKALPLDIQPDNFGTHVDQAMARNWFPSSPSSSPPAITHVHSTLSSGFRVPRGSSPPPLPTPATSSEMRKPQDTEIVSSLSSQSGSDHDTEEGVPTRDRSSIPGLAIPPRDEARRLQRRIRGVLPASWLRLDQQAQKKSSKPSPSKQARRHREQMKGIARKVSHSHHSRPSLSDSTVLISDDSEDVDDIDISSQTALSRTTGQSDENDDGQPLSDPTNNVTFENPINLDDIREDNRIDFMLPSLSRPAKRIRTGKLQTRLNVPSASSSRHIKQMSYQMNKSKKQPRITNHLPRNRQRLEAKPVPRLSVLDSTDLSPSSQQPPQFLKLAARRVRSKRNKGRHSPTRKFVRLSTRADTEEAKRTLDRWNSGAFLQRQDVEISYVGSSQSRPPLKNLQANGQTFPLQDKPWQKQTRNAANNAYSEASSADTHQGRVGRNNEHEPRHNLGKPQQVARLGKSQNVVSRQGHLISALRAQNAPRAAQLEAISTIRQHPITSVQFMNSLRTLSPGNLAPNSSQVINWNLSLSRFLSEREDVNGKLLPLPSRDTGLQESTIHGDVPNTQNLIRRLKKRPPMRIDTEVIELRQSIQPTIEIDDFEYDDSVTSPSSGVVLSGFVSPYEAYTIDFDTAHLQPGTFFHEDSFVGSGELARSVNIGERDLDRPAGYASLQFHGQSFRWGPWNETVSSDFGIVFQCLSDSFEAPAQQLLRNASEAIDLHGLEAIALRSITSYVTTHLSFIDRIDREAFAGRCIRLLRELSAVLKSIKPLRPPAKTLQVLMYALVFTNQIRQIIGQLTSAEARSSTLQDDVGTILHSLTEHSLFYVASDTGLNQIRTFLEANKQLREREAGVKDDSIYVCAIVIIHHVIESRALIQCSIWSTFSFQLARSSNVDPSSTSNIRDLEKLWSGVYALLPILEVDICGIFNPKARFLRQSDNWTFTQKLVQAITTIYLAHPKGQPASFNNYFRAILSRCFLLLKYWGWKKCEKILETLFDFFASIGLANLRNEDNFGSPKFLDTLENDTALELEPSDRSFHVLLKIIAQGVRGFNQMYSSSKVRSIVWRLMPNHGRSYPKEKPISHSELDALRNQHDLFCTLYWASPAGFRPRVSIIRNLIHPASSHREACSISIHSWSRLVRYQLTTDEAASMILPFSEWYDEFVIQMIEQHNAARTEAESISVVLNVSVVSMETTVAENQRQTEVLLTDALLSLSKAFKYAKVPSHTQVLMTDKAIPGVFGLLDTRNNRVNSVINQALDVVMSYLHVWQLSEKSGSNDSNPDVSEDSQDFGDWSGFEDVYQGPSTSDGIQHLQTTIYDALVRLISNSFGSDTSPADSLLLKLVDCWTTTAHSLVKAGLKQWSNYMDSYERESWTSLRNTDQTRKFTPLFFAYTLEKDPSCFEDNKGHLLNHWLSSLVERESMLKFQHRLTSALLNLSSQDPLLLNLPFSVNARSRKYDVSREDFLQRRLSLISGLLSSMRATFFEASCENRVRAQELRQDYRELLQHLMSAMKSNYQELGPEATNKGTYVNFVHRVVDYLQQYTVEICPVDRFFIDSAAFPLPANDPTYIVGRLRNYGLRLSEPGVPKQLVTFIQNVSERAAADEEPEHLAEQLHAAMSTGTYEAGIAERPTLRAFLLQNIFPAYVELALGSPAGWLIIEPILLSIQMTLKDLILDVNFYDPFCVDSVTSMLLALLEALRLSIDNYQAGARPHPIAPRVLRTITSTITSALPIVDYAVKSSDDGGGLLSYIRYFEEFIGFLRSSGSALGTCSLFPVSSHELPPPDATHWHEARTFASRELYNTIRKHWVLRDGIIYVQRGMSLRKELQLITEDPKAAEYFLNQSLRSFEMSVDALGLAQDEMGNLNYSVKARRRGVGIEDQKTHGFEISDMSF